MTALPARRRERTLVGAILTLVLVAIAGLLSVVGASTVVNSKEGEAVAGEVRPVVFLPDTDNAALAVIDDDNQLTSLVIVTLTPEGQGGSIVTVPVNADSSIGFGETRRPLNAEFDLADPDTFFETLEGTLAVSLQFGEVVARDRLEALLAPVMPIAVNLPIDVVDSNEPGTGTVVRRGETVLSELMVVRTLRALDEGATSYSQHETDVEVWTGLAANTPVAGAVEVPRDEFDRPVSSASIDEVFDRLWHGAVQVRDLALQAGVPTDGVDSVIIDRRDSLLVFSQISPARVSTPNPGLVFRIVVPYSDRQMLTSGNLFSTRSELARTLVGELLFLAANVVSTDTTPIDGGAAVVNRIEVADERFIRDMESLVPMIFGESEVVVADSLIDGVDVVLTLGTSYVDLKQSQGVAAPSTDPVGDVGDLADGSDGNPGVEAGADGATVTSDG